MRLRKGIVVGGAVLAMARTVMGHPPKEESYTITSVIEVVEPVDPTVMNDEFQEVRVLGHEGGVWRLEVTYYPLVKQAVGETVKWREADARMTEFLKPTVTENWDEGMRIALLAELAKAGIEPDKLTDKQVVERVSAWAMARAHDTNAFGVWAVTFEGGKPQVLPALRADFERVKGEKGWSDEEDFAHEVLGKGMFENKVHGSCTSSSIYLATIFKALGIPTRIVFCVPPFDPNDETQAEMFYRGVTHNRVRETVRGALAGERGFDNHLFNEVFVGGQWVRLNYSQLGQPILDRHYFGLLTHIDTTTDISTVPLAQTWGMRYFQHPAGQAKLSSVNPYRLVSVTDHFGSAAQIDNPGVTPAELRVVTIDGAYAKGSAKLPAFFRGAGMERFDLFISYAERVEAEHPMRTFYRRAGHDFVLKAPGCAPVRATWDGASVSAEGVETCALEIVAEDREKLVKGTTYEVEVPAGSGQYRWEVRKDVGVKFGEAEP